MPLTRDFDLLRSTISELQKCLDVQKDPSAGQVGINASRQRMTPRQSAETNRYIFRKRPNGFAYCKVLYKNGIPDDLLYLNVNETFKTLTGLKDVVGKRITEVIPGIKEIDTKLFDIYSRVVMTAQSETFEVYDKISGQWFSVSIYSPERDRIAFIFDVITDRKETEFALDENLKSLSQLTNLLDISSQPFAQGYLDGRVGLYNQAFLDLTGYSREEFSKINWATDLTPPEWMPFEIEKLTELTNTSQPVRYEKEYIRKDGSRIPVEVFAHLVRDDDGNPKFYYAFFTDITERKRAEKERHIALTKYKVLFDAFPLGITVADRSGQILESNQMAEKLLGLSPEEHKQRQIDGHEWQIIRTDGTLMPAEEYASVRALKEKRLIQNVEMGIVKSPTETTWISVTAAPIPLDKEVVVITYGDITYRKLSEQAIRESEQNYREIFNATNEAIVLHDIVTGRMLDMNDTAVRILGFETKTEALANSIGELSGNNSLFNQEEVLRRIRMAVEDGPQVFEWQIRRQNGELLWMEVSLSSSQIGSQGRVLAVIRDITERRRAEEENFSKVFYTSPSPLAISAISDGKIMAVNDAFCRLFEYTPEEMLNNTTDNLKIWESPTDREAALETLRNTGHFLQREARVRTKTGKICTVFGSLEPIFWKGMPCIIASVIDLTERKRIEQALEKNEEKYRQIVETAQEGIWLIDSNDRTVFVNLKLSEMLGYRIDELLEQSPQKLMAPEFFEKADNRLREHTMGVKHVIDYRFIRKDGSDLWCILSSRPVFDDQGQYAGSLAMITDITQRKRAEIALQESEEKLQLFIEHAPVSLAMFDRNMHYLFASHRWISDYGLGDREIIRYSHYEIFPEMPERWKEVHLRCLSGEVVKNDEDRFERQDGSVLWLRWEVRPWYTATKDIGGIVIFTEDITERKRIEAELAKQKSDEQFHALIENAPDAVVVQTDYLFSYINLAACRLFGVASPDQLLGQPVLDRVHPSMRAVVQEQIRVFNDERQISSSPVEHICLRVDGSEVPVEVIAAPIVYEGKNSALVFFHNITERMRAETERQKLQAELLQAQKMESVGRLAGGVAHDFNNMLNVIIGYTELIMHNTDPSSAQYRNLKEIISAAQRSAEITMKLLTFARKQTISPKVIDLNKTIYNTIKPIGRLIGENIELNWQSGKELWTIKMDNVQVDQILINLCVNSRDAIAGVGKIWIKTENVIIDQSYCAQHKDFVPGEFVLLTVSDSGHGMNKETLEHVFEPFYTTKELGRGTGLGLSTVYGIVKQNNGFITISSEPGKGTSIKIFFPRYEGTQNKTEIAEEILTGNGETVLVVENETAILDILLIALERLGYKALKAESPSEALRIVKESGLKIDLLITDLIMPEMNGRDLANRLQAEYSGIKVLYMSGFTAEVVTSREIQGETANFIQKPFTMKEIANKVRKVLDKN